MIKTTTPHTPQGHSASRAAGAHFLRTATAATPHHAPRRSTAGTPRGTRPRNAGTGSSRRTPASNPRPPPLPQPTGPSPHPPQPSSTRAPTAAARPLLSGSHSARPPPPRAAVVTSAGGLGLGVRSAAGGRAAGSGFRSAMACRVAGGLRQGTPLTAN